MSYGRRCQTKGHVPWSPGWGCVPVAVEPDQEPHKPPTGYAPERQPPRKGRLAAAPPVPPPPSPVQKGTPATHPTCLPPSG